MNALKPSPLMKIVYWVLIILSLVIGVKYLLGG